MNAYYLILFLLGICYCFYYKYKTVMEGLECDPNKPKVYSSKNGKVYGEKGYEPSGRECQQHSESNNEENLKIFELELEDIKKEVNEANSNITKQQQQHNENVSNTEKLIDSLNCRRDWPKKGDIDCNYEDTDDNDEGEGEGNEVDLDSDKRNAKHEAAKAEKPNYKF